MHRDAIRARRMHFADESVDLTSPPSANGIELTDSLVLRKKYKTIDMKTSETRHGARSEKSCRERCGRSIIGRYGLFKSVSIRPRCAESAESLLCRCKSPFLGHILKAKTMPLF